MKQREFPDGAHVRRRSNPDQSGIVVHARWSLQREEWEYRIQFGINVRAVPAGDLETVRSADPWGDAARGVLAGADAFREAMTFHRLRRPPGRIRASFGTARAAFYPFQFKPLLKLLEHPRQRILIADDVGLGKTIEAGYILRELQAHQALERVLVVCPARLRPKWRDELAQRFDERFDLVGGRELATFSKTLQRHHEPPAFRWITSYESARTEGFIKTLQDFEPFIDLVIIDEAHRLRNPSTLQNQLGRALSASAGAMVFLTATPVQTGIEDLYNLLHVLDPDTFQKFSEFQAQMEANRPVVRAMAHVRAVPPEGVAAAACLDQFARQPLTRHLGQGEFVKSLRDRVTHLDDMTRADLVALQRDIAELSLTSQILSRTRKVEVMPDRPQRNASSLGIKLTPEEQQVYGAVESICRHISPGHAGWGESMAMLMAYRYTASCIPAAVELFRQRLTDNGSVLGASADKETEDSRGWLEVPDDAQSGDTGRSRWPEEDVLAQIVRRGTEGLPDSKFDRFLRALNDLWRDDEAAGRAPRKVIVFSFFKRTLRYLLRRTSQEGIVANLIDGDVPIDERMQRIEDFANRDRIRVLLTSEVGGEGIDLQFASVIVNYDLPWNPMVVEQRIGRIDRIGQQSPVLTIINLAIEDTIETRILLRLYERIRIFKESIGEIDPIVGNRVLDLTIQALRGELSKEEQAAGAEQAALAALDGIQSAQRLVEQADGLLATDQAFLDEIEAMVGQRRVPMPDELHVFLRGFLAKRYHGTHLPDTVVSAVDRILLPPEVATDLRERLGEDVGAMAVARRIDQGDFQITMSQDAAVRFPRSELVHSRHPLIRLASKVMESEGTIQLRSYLVQLPVAALPSAVQPGTCSTYLFSIRLLELNGARPRTEVLAAFLSVDGTRSVQGEAAQQLVVQMLTRGQDRSDVPEEWRAAVLDWHVTLDELADQLKDRLDADETRLNAIRQARRVATLEATYRLRLDHARSRLEDLRQKRAPAFPIRMAEAKCAKLENDRPIGLRELDAGSSLQIIAEDVAVGILHIV